MKQRDVKYKNTVMSIVEIISEEINSILRANIYEITMSENELRELKEKKSELRNALKNCGIGDNASKSFVKDIIKEIILNNKKLLNTMDDIIPFSREEELSVRDKFDIILYQYIKKYGVNAMEHIFLDYDLNDKNNETVYAITAKDVEYIYKCIKNEKNLNNDDRVNIFVQRIYASYKGLGVIDDIRDLKIEGVSGGVSGTENQYNSVWMFFKGKTYHLEFLDFETEKELERISLNIYRYGNPGQLSKARGYVVNEMKDHSRVVVVRPPFAESFAFFVRKFDTIEQKNIYELIKDKNAHIVIDVLMWLIKGCRVCGITGSQGSGKTTLLMSLIGFIHPSYNLRIQELSFELNLRQVYPERNILSFRETDYVSGQEGLDIQKKTDGVVNILGEVASNSVAAWMVQMSQTGSLFTLFTHHAKTTEALIKYMRNSLLECNIFNNEYVALEQVTEAINFDIHLEKDINGHRYIERISEIIPDSNEKGYSICDIVTYNNGTYELTGNFSIGCVTEMCRYFDDKTKEVFYEKYCIQS